MLVNGRRVDTKGSTLHHHDRLVIGRAFAFRLVVPKELEVRSGGMNDTDTEDRDIAVVRASRVCVLQTMKTAGMTKQQTLDENESWDLDKVPTAAHRTCHSGRPQSPSVNPSIHPCVRCWARWWMRRASRSCRPRHTSKSSGYGTHCILTTGRPYYTSMCVYCLQGRIGEYKAQAFLHSFSKAQKLVDEANDITKEIRPKDRLRCTPTPTHTRHFAHQTSCIRFSLEVISDVYTYESDEPEFIVRLWRDKSAKQKFQMIVRQLRKPGLMEVFKKAKHTWKPDHRSLRRTEKD